MKVSAVFCLLNHRAVDPGVLEVPIVHFLKQEVIYLL